MDRYLALQPVAFHIEVVCNLQIQPEPIRGAEEELLEKDLARVNRRQALARHGAREW